MFNCSLYFKEKNKKELRAIIIIDTFFFIEHPCYTTLSNLYWFLAKKFEKEDRFILSSRQSNISGIVFQESLIEKSNRYRWLDFVND